MVKQIIQQLLEYQGAVSSEQLSKNLKQPLSIIEEYLYAIDSMNPGLLLLTHNYDNTQSEIMVKISESGESEAKRLLNG